MAIEGLSLSRLSAKAQIIVFLLLALVLSGVFYMYYLGPLREEVAGLEAERRTLQAQVEEGRAVQARLPQFKKEVERQEARLHQLKEALPDEKETAEIVLQIQKLAEELDLRIKSFTPQETEPNDFYDDWPILISIEGTYNNLGTFFEQISEFQRLINVDDLNIKTLEDPSQTRTIGATCTAVTFVFREDVSAAVTTSQPANKEVATAF